MNTILDFYDGYVSQIDRVEFDIWGSSEIKAISTIGNAAGIDIPDLYDNSEPKKGGLIDPRLGTIGNDSECVTCGLSTIYCPGHFGHIDLADYVFHIGYLPYLHRIMSCICPRCSKLIVYKNEDEIKELLRTKNGKERLAYMKALSKNITHCQKPDYGCGTPIPKIKIDQKKSSPTINVIAETDLEASKDENGVEGKKKLKQKLTPDIIYDILKNISDEDCVILGMDPKRSRPEDMIHKIFPVPPVQMRPSTKGDFMGGSTMEDDLTHKLADIVKANLRIIKNKENQNEAGSKYNADHTHLLQYHVATYFDNDSLSLPKSEQKGKPLKSVSERIKTKEGRIRGNLMGKRGDFTARTVITSDPTIENNQLGVPVKIAMNLTFPEVVTKYNIDNLTELVRRGRDQYPGANWVFPVSNGASGRRVMPIDLRFKREKVELKYGDIVERHLKDGDIVLLNRQPTLHKQSMMGHRIKVINDPNLLTYRLSVAITTPYNADFDGDEMNIFLAQSLQTQIELEEIAGVERQLITPTTSKTIIGIVQDGLLGAYNLTAPTVRIDWRNAMNLMSYTSIEDFSSFKKNQAYSGQELYSLIVPSGVNVDRANMKIKNGKIIEGQLTKEYLGSKKKNNLIQLIWDGYGVTETKNFIDNTQRLINNFNLYNGFTVGIGDAYIPPNIVEEIDKVYNTKELKVEHMITEMENTPDIMEQSVYEMKLCAEIGEVRDQVNKLVINNLAPDNKFQIMSSSGSKGDSSNTGQMSGGLGPQAFEGKLMPKKYNKRTLSYFHQNDDRGASRGLVRRSFIDGLEFPEFVFHLAASRLGLIDGAIKSVAYDTDIVIQEDGHTKSVQIGKWIDDKMEANKKLVEHHDKLDQELLKLSNEVYIPTCDEKGVTSWEKVTDVTRHDPTKEMYEIFTYGGRNVVVADSESLLIWNVVDEVFEPVVTHDVKVGDYVPVTWSLPAPKKINKHIDMTKYFPKTEYLYGTDYHIAERETNKIMEGRIRTPPGWWDKHNGTTFTTPFWRAADLIRSTSGRSETDCIKDGFIYSFHKSRAHGLPEKFLLNRDNGVFIGLFLADGDADSSGGHVQITKKSPSVQKFVKKWFDNLGINHYTVEQKRLFGINKDIEGTTHGVQGFSLPLVNFLHQLVGHGCANKRVPDEAFDAPDEFIIGLLDGYFSGDGCIGNGCVTVTSISKALIEGISMLCSRVGIIGRVSTTQQMENNLGTKNIKPIHTLSIRGQWAKTFKEKITLTNKDKNSKLEKMKNSKAYDAFDERNDIVLDKIISIEKVNSKNHKKLYDVTVKNTLNFQTRSGLIIRDTSETGYMQRKLVKSMEDLMIKNDGTVRSANDQLLQVVYGDSGADTTKQYEYVIKMLEMNNADIEKKYKFTDAELKSYKGYSSDDNDAHYKELIHLRNTVRRNIRNAKLKFTVLKLDYMIPINLRRIIDTVLSLNVADKSDTKLDPTYILTKLNEVLGNSMTSLMCLAKENKDNVKSFKYKDEIVHKLIFKTALFDALSPKRALLEHNMNKTQFDTIVADIIASYNKNIVEPGEMIGVIAAQSMGEQLTQFTLNSFHHSGIASMSAATHGVPRIKEILSVSKSQKTPQMIVYLTDEYKNNREMSHKIASHIKYTTLGNVRGRVDVYYDPVPKAKGGIMEQDNVKHIFYNHAGGKSSCQSDINGLPWLLRITIDREKMLEKEVTLLEIKSKFCSWWEKRFAESKSMKKEEKKVINKITQLAVLSNSDNDVQPYVHIRFNVKDADKDKDQFGLETINNFVDFIIDKFKLKGITSVTGIPAIAEERVIKFNEETGDIEKNTQYVIYTSGVNMIDIRYFVGVDILNTISNDVVEAYNTFGIEVARTILLKEIMSAYEGAGGEVNYQHISVIVDLMTSAGSITSIDRHGMNKSDNDPLSRASFEKSVEQLLTAAVFGEVDHMKGISSRIMAGAVIKGGTGYCDVVLDTEMIEKSEFSDDGGYTKVFTELAPSTIATDIKTTGQKHGIFVPA